MRALCLACAIAALPSWAGAKTLVFACTFPNGSSVDVSHTNTSAFYRFETAEGRTALHLVRRVTDVHLTPWPGIGRTIWEEVVFRNKGHDYLVYASIERVYPEDETAEIETTVSGGVIVSQDGTELAHLECAPNTVDFPWGTSLYDAKTAAGQCYDRANRKWSAC